MAEREQGFSIKRDWCDIDMLNGVAIATGDAVRFRWPDGQTVECVVTVDRWDEEGSDMGVRCSIPTAQGFILIEHHGAAVRTRLRDVAEYIVTEGDDG